MRRRPGIAVEQRPRIDVRASMKPCLKYRLYSSITAFGLHRAAPADPARPAQSKPRSKHGGLFVDRVGYDARQFVAGHRTQALKRVASCRAVSRSEREGESQARDVFQGARLG